MDPLTAVGEKEIDAAALEFITPNSPRKVVRRPKTDAPLTEFSLPFNDGILSLRSWQKEFSTSSSPKIALLIHGWASNQTDMFNYVPPLVEQGYRVVAMDLPAHGESSGETAGLDHLADGVVAVGRYLGHLDVVIAHSIGCAALQLAIASGLDLARAVLLASPANYEAGALYTARSKGFDEIQTKLMIANLARRGVRVAIFSKDFLPSFRLPALIVHATDDPVIPVSVAADIASLWTGSQLLVVQGLKHRGVLKDQSLIEKVIEFACR